jgi:beta-N-acetylhexosaminidase
VATAKHFPGLGRVRANPDIASGVTDPVTGPRDPYLEPFRTAVRAGVPVVMMSTAFYPRLDRTHPAAFSRTVIDGLLRRRLGFRGVVVSDDLGSARQVARYPYGVRAVRFLAAGGDLVLTVDPATLPAMHRAVLARTRSSPAFRQRVEQAALRVLRIKQRHGLLH